MLSTRVATAFLLLCGLAAALQWAEGRGWLYLVSGIAACGAWEWQGLADRARAGARASVPNQLVAGAIVLTAVLVAGFTLLDETGVPRPATIAWLSGIYALAALFWVGVVPWCLKYHDRAWPRPWAELSGIVVLLPAALALAHLRALGAITLLLLLAGIWIADTAAYFVGRALGRHKLAPAISPAKTWEGAIGAAMAVSLYGVLLLADGPVAMRVPLPVQIVGLIALAAVSIVGDLYESLLKRHAHVKDSGKLLPGHGGVLDRIDSLTATLPLLGLMVLSFGKA